MLLDIAFTVMGANHYVTGTVKILCLAPLPQSFVMDSVLFFTNDLLRQSLMCACVCLFVRVCARMKNSFMI